MSLTAFEDIFSLAQVSDADKQKEAAAKELDAVKQRIDAVASSVPDDKEDLQEEQEQWCREWQPCLLPLHAALTKVRGCGLTPRLEDELAKKMRCANTLFRRWQGELAMRQAEANASKNAKKDASDAFQPSGLLGPVTGDAGTKRKRVRKETSAADEGDADDEELEVSAVVRAPPSVVPNQIVHDPACEVCAKSRKQCVGIPGRTCDSCCKSKSKCNKSRGRGGKGGEPKETKGEAGETKCEAGGTKGKAPARATARIVIPARKAQAAPARIDPPQDLPRAVSPPAPIPEPVDPVSPLFFASPSLPPPELPQDRDDDDENPRKRQKIDDAVRPSPEAVADAKRAFLSLEAKILSSRAFLKELEARASGMGAYVASQQQELERLRAVLELL
ncbi:hypothetical protein J3R83DRAFT_9000 [Lanmaoa asiatica]|nr:hypothetical protein J3R83DRAFT_8984 [Lanmaoa asiatica]KAH0825761.1 hypothetical protein J3R83DRAFT_9000 [Lanmaoa asiatica]